MYRENRPLCATAIALKIRAVLGLDSLALIAIDTLFVGTVM